MDLLAVRAYAIFDHAAPDRAGPWIDRCEPEDPDAAYLLELYPTLALARAALSPRAHRVAREISPRNPELAARFVRDIGRELTVRHVATGNARGRDYRRCGCSTLPDILPQIRSGERQRRAWREILRQRELDAIDGALLPGPTPAGTLFIFITAGSLEISAPL